MVYKYKMHQKLKDRRYVFGVCNYVRSLVMFVCVFVLCMVFVYVLLSWPDTKRKSMSRVRRMKEQADVAYELCIDPSNATSVAIHSEVVSVDIEPVPLCSTPFGVLRCNVTVPLPEDKTKKECDEGTMYYHSLKSINTEANKESVVRILNLEPNVCGNVCWYYVDMFEENIHNQPHVSVMMLTTLMMSMCYFFLDCKSQRNDVRVQSLRISMSPPGHFQHDTLVDPPPREFTIIEEGEEDEKDVIAMLKQD